MALGVISGLLEQDWTGELEEGENIPNRVGEHAGYSAPLVFLEAFGQSAQAEQDTLLSSCKSRVCHPSIHLWMTTSRLPQVASHPRCTFRGADHILASRRFLLAASIIMGITSSAPPAQEWEDKTCREADGSSIAMKATLGAGCYWGTEHYVQKWGKEDGRAVKTRVGYVP